VGDLSLYAAFVHVVVPTANVSECDLNAEVGLNELRHLSQAVAKASARIIGAGSRSVFFRISGFQHLYGFKGLVTGAVQHGVNGLLIHGLKTVAHNVGTRATAADGKFAYVAHGDRGNCTGQSSRESAAHRNCAEGRSAFLIQAGNSAVQPAIL